MAFVDRGPIAIDTNVIIYAFNSEETDRKGIIAREILRRAGGSRIRLPLQVASEAFSVLTKKRHWTARAASDVISALLEDIPHIVVTSESMRAAMALCVNHQVAFWDASIVTAAAAAGCGVIVTEDLQDRRRFDPPDVDRRLLVIDPFRAENSAVLKALGVLNEDSY